MARKKTTVYVDEDILRAARVMAARTGKRDSDIFEEALRAYTKADLFERVRSRSSLTEDEALELAYEELHAMRRERDG
jgi:Ribbon-helix-helix protein, copG family